MAYIIKDPAGQPVMKNGKELNGADFIGVVKSVDREARTLRIIASDETKDRDGDIIKQAGWKFENYIKNPVFLWGHDYTSIPLAAAKKIERKREPSRLVLTHRFPTVGLNPLADMVFNLYDEKIINAGSVGFVPTKWEDIVPEEGEAGQSPRGMFYRTGRKFLEQELLEHSGCAVPANPSAIQEAVKSVNFPDYMSREKFYQFINSGNLKGFSLPENQLKNLLAEIQEIKAKPIEIEDDPDKVIVQVPASYKSGEVEVHDENIMEGVEEISKDLALKPYPNEHACRLKDPSNYDKFARKNCAQKHDGQCIDVIYGINDQKTEIQALRYPKEKWSADDAKKHCAGRGGKFEAAKSVSSMPIMVPLDSPLPTLLLDVDAGKFYALAGDAGGDYYKAANDPWAPLNQQPDDGINVTDELLKIFREIIEGYFSAGLQKEVGDKYIDRVEVLVKAGAVLNRKNKARLKQASDLIANVLAEAGGEEEQEDDAGNDAAAESASDSSSVDGKVSIVEPPISEAYFGSNLPGSSGGQRVSAASQVAAGHPQLVEVVPTKVLVNEENAKKLAAIAVQIERLAAQL